MKSHVSPEQLSAFVDRVLDGPEMRAVDTHLRTCEDCRRQVDEFRQLRERLRPRAAAQVPPFFAARVTAAVRARRTQRFADEMAWVAKRWAAGMALVLLIVLLWFARNPAELTTAPEEMTLSADSTATLALLGTEDQALSADEVLQLAVWELPR